jgi:desulfoferrodoxin-like iron-binding protein
MDPSEGGTAAWHVYRCPVCGHTDEVLMEGGPEGTLPCSHCATPLELVVRSPDQAAVAVKVAARWRRVR